ncbi:uncharacterized protein RBU33_016988 isoform 2-T20 [Hipposideros larvatus]
MSSTDPRTTVPTVPPPPRLSKGEAARRRKKKRERRENLSESISPLGLHRKITKKIAQNYLEQRAVRGVSPGLAQSVLTFRREPILENNLTSLIEHSHNALEHDRRLRFNNNKMKTIGKQHPT